MAEVTLNIVSPQHQQEFDGDTAIAFEIEVLSRDPAGLFFNWYSSLKVPESDDPNDVPINPIPRNTLTFSPLEPVPVGSQVISVMAKDQQGDDLDALEAVVDAGMAGGPAPASLSPCVIHVYRATMRWPDPWDMTLGKASAVLEAVAPYKWGKEKEPDEEEAGAGEPAERIYENDPDYHAINRIYYRWRFEPADNLLATAELPPAGATAAERALFMESLQYGYDEDEATAFVRYDGSLPDALVVGATYDVVLRVESKENFGVGDEVSQSVTITA